jgi:serine/threonine-protein phosphatase PP1 catalytic subunit
MHGGLSPDLNDLEVINQ